MNWTTIWDRVWRLIETPGECYFGGPRFLNLIRSFQPELLQYGDLMDSRRRQGLSTDRHDYLHDTLMELDEPRRINVVATILERVGPRCSPSLVAEIRGLLSGAATEFTELAGGVWDVQRLQRLRGDIDAAIGAARYEQALSRAHAGLEGFYAAFVHARGMGAAASAGHLLALSQQVCSCLRDASARYPHEVSSLVEQTALGVERARDRCREAPCAGESDRWLAAYIRDLVDAQIRLLLHFM